MIRLISKINNADWKTVLVIAILVMIVTAVIHEILLEHFFKSSFQKFSNDFIQQKNFLEDAHRKAVKNDKKLDKEFDRVQQSVSDTIDKANSDMQKSFERVLNNH